MDRRAILKSGAGALALVGGSAWLASFARAAQLVLPSGTAGEQVLEALPGGNSS